MQLITRYLRDIHIRRGPKSWNLQNVRLWRQCMWTALRLLAIREHIVRQLELSSYCDIKSAHKENGADESAQKVIDRKSSRSVTD